MVQCGVDRDGECARFPPISRGRSGAPIGVTDDPFSDANRGYGFAEFRIVSAPRRAV